MPQSALSLPPRSKYHALFQQILVPREDGKGWSLGKEEFAPAKVSTFRTYLIREARLRGVIVKTRMGTDGRLYVQAMRKTS